MAGRGKEGIQRKSLHVTKSSENGYVQFGSKQPEGGEGEGRAGDSPVLQDRVEEGAAEGASASARQLDEGWRRERAAGARAEHERARPGGGVP